MFRLLEVLRNDDCDWLTVEVDRVLLQHREGTSKRWRNKIIIRFGTLWKIQTRRVLMRDDCEHTRRAQCCFSIDRSYASARDRAHHEYGVRQVRDVKLSGVTRAARHLQSDRQRARQVFRSPVLLPDSCCSPAVSCDC